MRSFHGLASDRQNGIDRAYFEAEHGRVHLALERLISLHQHYSGDAGITYAEGYIRQEHLGQGLLAGKLYRETFAIDNRHARALGGVTQFAPEEQEYRKWAAIALQRRIEGLDVIRAHLAALDGGNSYTALLVDASQQAAEDNEYGMAAALLEIALATKELNANEEVSVRRNRAQHLRELDAKSCLQREAMCETFPAVERLALHAALEEIENALGLNTEYVELWTLKSAYLADMARFQDAITCADEAITRRPNGYAKPWFNKCNALIQLGRYDDAMECLQRALAQAHAAGSEADVTQTRNMMHAYEGSRREASDEEIAGVFRAIEEGAQRASQEEIERWPWPVNTLENLVRGVIGRAPIAHRETALAYVPLLQKLLEDVTPESAFCAMKVVRERDAGVARQYLLAGLYLSARTNGLVQRAALRFIVLSAIAGQGRTAARATYRAIILELCATGGPQFASLDGLIRGELERIGPRLSGWVADQEPVDARELAHGQEISEALSGDPVTTVRAEGPEAARGCGTTAVLLMAALWGIWRLYVHIR